MTPRPLAKAIYDYFRPAGVVMEPCRGTGNFYHWFPEDSPWCEISEGRDFFDWNERVDWIITNPPWSQVRNFLVHSMEIADQVVFLMTINHLWTRARLRDIREKDFVIRTILLCDTPREFPQLGFQLGVVHLARRARGKFPLKIHLDKLPYGER